MKLASLKSSRDGKLIVVSRDLHYYTDAGLIAPTLQAALDDWGNCEPLLRALAESLEHGSVPRERFHEREAHSPLPRAYHWADGSAYVNHVELVRKARGAEMPATFWTDPLIYQGGGDDFLPPRADIPLANPEWGCDLEGEVAVITDDVPQGIDAVSALSHIKLIMICNDVSLRGLIPNELAKGFGFYQSKPASAFSPVAVSPDELGDKWVNGKLHLPLYVEIDDKPFGRANAGIDMVFDFGKIIAHTAKTRNLGAGTIIGSGTVSNKGADGGPGLPIEAGGLGYSCIAEQRTVETLLGSDTISPFLQYGQKVRIWMEDEKGHSIFGAIEQRVSLAT